MELSAAQAPGLFAARVQGEQEALARLAVRHRACAHNLAAMEVVVAEGGGTWIGAGCTAKMRLRSPAVWPLRFMRM